ncbi:MAG: PepSY-like domain-containing protein [Bacteroidales bacterium]
MTNKIFKTSIRSFFIVLLAAISFIGCNKDKTKEDPNSPSKEVLQAFAKDFPGATNITWKKHSNYDVASFDFNKQPKSKAAKTNYTSWYLPTGDLTQIEREIPFDSLPQIVRDTFNLSFYANAPWVIDEVEIQIKPGLSGPLYKIEVEKTSPEEEVDLYYNSEGLLLREVLDSDDEFQEDMPVIIPEKIIEFLSAKYPNCRIDDFDFKKKTNIYKAKIYINKIEYEVYFDASSVWLGSAFEIDYKTIPTAIQTTVTKDYSAYEIDEEALQIEGNNKKTYYGVSMEQTVDGKEKEYMIVFSPEGSVVKSIELL